MSERENNSTTGIRIHFLQGHCLACYQQKSLLINSQTLKMIPCRIILKTPDKEGILEEGRGIQRPKRCVITNKNTDEDNILKNHTQKYSTSCLISKIQTRPNWFLSWICFSPLLRFTLFLDFCCDVSTYYYYYYYHYYYYYYYYYSFESFSHQRELMIFQWTLSDSNSPQVSRTLLSNLADLNNAVFLMFSPCPLISKPSSTCINPFGIVKKETITIGIIVIFMFHSFSMP